MLVERILILPQHAACRAARPSLLGSIAREQLRRRSIWLAPFGPVNPYRLPAENVVVTSPKSVFEPYRIDTPSLRS